MAAPTIEAVNETNGSTAATNKVCNLPSGIIADSLLILAIRSVDADTHSTPSGWTAWVLNNSGDLSNDTTSIFFKIADGSETSTVTVNGTANLKFASISWRVHNYDKTLGATFSGSTFGIDVSSITTGNSTAPNGLAIVPTNPGGSRDYLYGNISAYEGEQTDPPTFPANYTDGQSTANSGTGGAVATNCRVNIGGFRSTGTTSNDPGAWTISSADDWSVWGFAVYPGNDPVVTARGVGWYGPDGWF